MLARDPTFDDAARILGIEALDVVAEAQKHVATSLNAPTRDLGETNRGPENAADPGPLRRVPLEEFRALFAADMQAERFRTSRIMALHLLALAGGLCWVLMNWPKVLPWLWHVVALAGWPAGLALLLLF